MVGIEDSAFGVSTAVVIAVNEPGDLDKALNQLKEHSAMETIVIA